MMTIPWQRQWYLAFRIHPFSGRVDRVCIVRATFSSNMSECTIHIILNMMDLHIKGERDCRGVL